MRHCHLWPRDLLGAPGLRLSVRPRDADTMGPGGRRRPVDGCRRPSLTMAETAERLPLRNLPYALTGTWGLGQGGQIS